MSDYGNLKAHYKKRRAERKKRPQLETTVELSPEFFQRETKVAIENFFMPLTATANIIKRRTGAFRQQRRANKVAGG